MITVLGDQHLGQQTGCRNPFIDDLRRHRRLGQCLTVFAYPFTAHMPFDPEGAGDIVELLTDVFTDARHLAATGTGRLFGFMLNNGSGQLRWQRPAPGVLFGLSLGFGR